MGIHKPPPIGQKFNRLTVIGESYDPRRRGYDWKCRCDCGNVIVTNQSNLKNGHTISCGCARLDGIRRANRTHGKSGQSIHRTWLSMIQRCTNPKRNSYPRYGGRGIKVCERWRTFENFYADMGDRPSDAHTLDRYPDNDGNYEPGNCRWATRREQYFNSSTGKAQKMREWEAKAEQFAAKAREETRKGNLSPTARSVANQFGCTMHRLKQGETPELMAQLAGLSKAFDAACSAVT